MVLVQFDGDLNHNKIISFCSVLALPLKRYQQAHCKWHTACVLHCTALHTIHNRLLEYNLHAQSAPHNACIHIRLTASHQWPHLLLLLPLLRLLHLHLDGTLKLLELLPGQEAMGGKGGVQGVKGQRKHAHVVSPHEHNHRRVLCTLMERGERESWVRGEGAEVMAKSALQMAPDDITTVAYYSARWAGLDELELLISFHV